MNTLDRLRFYSRAALGLTVLCAVAVATGVRAATVTVTNTADSGAGTLRAALANVANGDRINFSITGTITLTTGELLITRNVTITGPGADKLAINGNAASRVFHIAPSNTVTIAGLTVTNGRISVVHGTGGGILNDHAILTINNCTISGNSAIGLSAGGGIFNDGQGGSASVHIANSTVTGNSADVRGGGIFNFFATLTVSNCTLSGNSAASVGYGGGGCIFNGGINSLGSASLQIVNSTLSSNSAGQGRGGGIWNDGEFGRANTEIVNSTLSSNSARDGGGIFNDGFVGNANLRIVNTTLSGNSASGGSGSSIYNYGISGSATLEIGNTILDAGASGDNIFNYVGTVTSLGYNLSSDAGVSNFFGTGSLIATGDQINTDPMLGPLQDNGGPTFTHSPLCGSPAVDRGKSFSVLATDQRGVGFDRTFDDLAVPNATGGDNTDIGAFEAQQPFSVCDRPPVADARATPRLVISANGADATVILDGARSSDPDGDVLQYSWYEAGASVPLASGVVAVTVLPVGTHSILLVVNDGTLSATNAITIEVITAAQAVEQLIAAANSDVSRSAPLRATLAAAIASIERSNPTAAVNQLLAFQNQVRAQVAPLEAALADTFIEVAQQVIDALSGGSTNPGEGPHGRFTSVTHQSGGRVQMQFSGEPGRSYIIEASTNLTDWERIGVATGEADGSLAFEDAQPTRFPSRFYRIVPP